MLITKWKPEDALAVEREEGEAIGLARGENRGKVRMTGKLKARGMPPEQITAVTGLGPADLAAL
jgi:hypothetical protein